MAAYIARRTLLAVLTLFTVSFLSWLIIQLPEGDYIDMYVNQIERNRGTTLTIQEQAEVRVEWGLNQPMLKQYWDWLSGIILHADFGRSYSGFGKDSSARTPNKDLLKDRIPLTIALTGFTILVTWTLAIPIGIYSAVRQHSIGDYTFTFLGFTGLAVPDFLLGLVLMYVFLAYFHQSVGGLFSGDYQFAPWSFAKVVDLLQHMIIPAIVLGTAGTAGLIRIMRNNLLDELEKPYVITARAKGQVEWKLIAKYPVRVAINPFISGIGGMLPALVGGSVIVSVVLSLPTLGPLLLTALRFQDLPLAGAILLLLAVLTVVGTLISDIMLVVVDPRIKLTGPSR